MTVVVSVEQVSKSYRLGMIGGRTLREDVARWTAAWRGKEDPTSTVGGLDHSRRIGDLFWALENVSFDVREGEVLGIVGRNGAGKSTILKILSQVTAPTAGRIRIKGRIASLLEVGTGFHPELTGRENAFLNGAILGMTKREVRRKLDEIIDFSGVEEFIDTPVKRYSSGMYLRLAFAVAAHLDPEILVVDEVLAVGDADFQRKCLGKMGEVAQGGRTILFVSHNLGAVRTLCHRAVLIDGGLVRLNGSVSDVIATYLARPKSSTARGIIEATTSRIGTGEARFTAVVTMQASGQPTDHYHYGETPIAVDATFDVHEEISDGVLEASIFTPDGVQITMSTTSSHETRKFKPGRHAFTARIDTVLVPGQYAIAVGIHHTQNGKSIDYVERAIEFEVLRVGRGGEQYFAAEPRGYIWPPVEWRVDETF